MILHMFTVYDSKAEAFLQPFFSQSRGTAIRSFSEAANDEKHQFHRHAGDFTLFELGEFDQLTADVKQLQAPVKLGTALEYIEVVPDNVVNLGGSK